MLNPRLADLRETLRESLSVHRVDGLEEFPFKDYSEFIDALNEGHVEVLTGEDPELFGALAGPGAKWAHRVMGWSTFLVAGVCALAWWPLGNASLLGVPLAFIGAVLSARAFMRSVGLWLNRGLIGVAMYFLYQATPAAALLVASYLVPNYLYHWRRHLSRRIFLRAAAESELLLVWLFSKGQLVPVVDSPVPARAGRRRSDKALQPSTPRVSAEPQPRQELPGTHRHSKTPLTLVVGQSSRERPQAELVRHLGGEGGRSGAAHFDSRDALHQTVAGSHDASLWRQSEETGDVRPKTGDSLLRDVGAISAAR